MPKQALTPAQALVVIVRMMDGMQNEKVTPRYDNYLKVGEQKGYVPFWYRYFDTLEKPITRLHVG